MAVLGKITRILVKTLKYLFVLIILLFVFVIIAVNTPSVQTWLGQRAASYLASELGTKVEVGKIQLHFIKSAVLEDVFIEDHIHDTLLFSKSIKVELSGFDYKKQQLTVDKVTLSDTKAFIVKHKDQEDFNFQHLADYFSSDDTTTSTSKWKINFGKLILDNVDFTYKNAHHNTDVSANMNYNNIHVTEISGELSNIKLIEQSIFADIKGLKAREQCGMILEDLTTEAKVSNKSLICRNFNLKTKNSTAKGTLAFRYNDWEDYQDFIDSVEINGMLLEGTKIHFKDIAYFAKELNGLDKEVVLYGKMDGTVKDFKGQSLYLSFGEHSLFTGDLIMRGLPDIHSTYIEVDAQHLGTSKKDLEKIPTYPFNKNKFIKLPSELSRLGEVSYKGKYKGTIYNFVTNGAFKTSIGNAKTDIAIQIDTVKHKVNYLGLLVSEGFNLGKLLAVPELGAISLNSKVKGSGFTLKELNAIVDGKISSLSYNNYVYQDVTINGNIKNRIFNGALVSHDNNADFDFNGSIDFTGKIPDFDFISTINKINLKRLGFINSAEDGFISSQILMKLNGDNIDNLTGLINFDNTIYKTQDKEYKISTFDLTLDQITTDKSVKLTSNIFNLSVNGPFKISNMEGAFNQFLYAYYPAFVAKPKTKAVFTDAFKYKVTIRKFNTISELFLNDLMLSYNSVFEGDFDASKNIFNLNLKSDSVRYKDIRFNNSRIESYSQNNKINLVFKSDRIILTDSIALNNYFMYLVSKDKSTKFNLEWNNKTVPNNKGKLFGKIFFENNTATFSYEDIFLTARDSTWKMITANNTVIDSSGSLIINPIVFANGGQRLSINGTLSNRPKDKLIFEVSDFDLYQLSPFFGKSLKIKGIVNGSVTLQKSMGNLAFSSKLGFNKLNINDNNLGEGELNTEYFNADKYIYLDGFTSLGFTNFNGDKLKNISFNGYYYLDKKEESLDVNLDANPANLNLLNPYLKGILSLNSSLIVGNAKITGTPSKPVINGKFKITRCEMKIDYLNVTYNVIGLIEVLPDQIRFEELKIGDDLGRKDVFNGTLNGNIFHDNFKNMRIDYDINFSNMLVLNKPHIETEPFYGKVYASGNAGIFGFFNKIDMQINAKTDKNTLFTIPLDNPSQVGENNFIHFIVKDTLKNTEQIHQSGFTLDMSLEATQDAEAQIIFDEKSGDIIKARGAGNLKLVINNRGKFDMTGEYVINNGVYMFTLENFITKKFDIKKGSTINWSGSPYQAEIDITAVYKQRASVSPLFPYETTNDDIKRRLPVECKLYMKETLLTPNITFGIDLPTTDEMTRAKIKSILTDETELNRQVFSLLLLKSFVTPLQYSQGGGNIAGSALAANGTEMLSNRLSGWLNNLTKEVDIGVNYRPGDQVSNDELDVALSKQLLNNRLTVDGNIGYNSNQTNNSSGLIGDVNLEYKLTDDGRYRVKGFNRGNDNTQTATSGGPFTQGVGVFYREEFEAFDDIFKRYMIKIKSLVKKPKSEPAKAPENTESGTK